VATVNDLRTWRGLNAALRSATERRCRSLLLAENRGERRPAFLRRIHNKLNKLRMWRERLELMK